MPVTLNHESFDQEHRALYDAAYGLLGASPEKKHDALEELYRLTLQHFASEDEDLRRYPDANTQCHLNEHRNVLCSLQEVADVLRGTEHTHSQKCVLINRLASTFLQWLPSHVEDMDSALANSLFKAASGGMPVKIVRRHTINTPL